VYIIIITKLLTDNQGFRIMLPGDEGNSTYEWQPLMHQP